MDSLLNQFGALLLLALPVACASWTVTHEEIFREPREYCIACTKSRSSLLARKFFYVFTCEYCFSHYVALFFIYIAHFRLLFADWRGALIGWFALVWIANVYMSAYNLLRIDLKKEKLETERLEE
ncbi:MAG: hypothetical protein U0T73_12775 [Chitinophagales bacterium]